MATLDEVLVTVGVIAVEPLGTCTVAAADGSVPAVGTHVASICGAVVLAFEDAGVGFELNLRVPGPAGGGGGVVIV